MATMQRAPDNNHMSKTPPPLFNAFQRICFTRPGYRDQTRNEDKGDWYTNVELEWMLGGLFAKRMLFFEKITSQICSNIGCCRFDLTGQRFENAIIRLLAYLSLLEGKKGTIPWDPEHFVEDEKALAAHKTLFKTQMVYQITREHQPVTAQADPQSGSRVHFLSRDAASRGFDEYVGQGASIHHLYPAD